MLKFWLHFSKSISKKKRQYNDRKFRRVFNKCKLKLLLIKTIFFLFQYKEHQETVQINFTLKRIVKNNTKRKTISCKEQLC